MQLFRIKLSDDKFIIVKSTETPVVELANELLDDSEPLDMQFDWLTDTIAVPFND